MEKRSRQILIRAFAGVPAAILFMTFAACGSNGTGSSSLREEQPQEAAAVAAAEETEQEAAAVAAAEKTEQKAFSAVTAAKESEQEAFAVVTAAEESEQEAFAAGTDAEELQEEAAEENDSEEIEDLGLSAGSYMPAPDMEMDPDGELAELNLWENGVGILEDGEIMYGISWTPEHLRIEKEDIDYSGRWWRPAPEENIPVLVFSFNGKEYQFVYESDIMPDYYWGPSEYDWYPITGTYYAEDGAKAVFLEDGTGTLEADGKEQPFFWGHDSGDFLWIDSYLSAVERTGETIRFSVDSETTYTMESEQAIAQRELEAKIQDIAQYYLPLGNAGELDGRIVVYTVFASGPDYSWDFTRPEDQEVREQSLYDLAEGLEWIRNQAALYGRNVEFLYDWNADPELAAEYTSEYPMALSPRSMVEAKEAEGEIISTSELFAKQNIAYELANAKELKEKYQADGVVYLFLVNTGYENTEIPHAIDYDPESLITKMHLSDIIETVTIHVRYTDTRNPEDEDMVRSRYSGGETYAHEILHLFGARDLYKEGYNIPQEYVDHLKAVGSTDIMASGHAGDWSSGRTTLSEVTAYYLGLTDHCDDVELYGLGKSQHAEADG